MRPNRTSLHPEPLLRYLRPMAAVPGGAFSQVAHLAALLQDEAISLERAVRVLRELGIHPWSLLGGYGAWAEIQRDWGLRLGLPGAWVDALGLRPCRGGFDETLNPAATALRVPVDLGLEHLPEGLKLRNLEILHCPRLERLGPGLAVQENLSLHACGLLKTLPGDLEVGGRLGITDCPCLREVALNTAPAAVVLVDDGALRELRLPPAFEGDLVLRSCRGLDRLSLPGGTLGNLYIGGCGDLGPLPVARVRGRVFLQAGMDSGTVSLPPGLRIDGAAWLGSVQTEPVRLPTGLRIGADLILDLTAASGVTIPPDTRVAGSLYLSAGNPFQPWTESIPGSLRVLAFEDIPDLPAFRNWGEPW